MRMARAAQGATQKLNLKLRPLSPRWEKIAMKPREAAIWKGGTVAREKLQRGSSKARHSKKNSRALLNGPFLPSPGSPMPFIKRDGAPRRKSGKKKKERTKKNHLPLLLEKERSTGNRERRGGKGSSSGRPAQAAS